MPIRLHHEEPPDDNPIHHAEAAAVIALAQDMDLLSVQNGDWHDPDTWGGVIPKDGQRVCVSEGHVVALEGETARLKSLCLDGNLEIVGGAETHLRAGTVIVLHLGTLEVGIAAHPITANARITFLDDGPIDLKWDPKQLSRGLVSLGKVLVHGKPKLAWTTADGVAATNPPPAPAHPLGQQYHLHLHPDGDFYDWGGAQERWLLGDGGWYYLFPDGTFYLWSGTGMIGTLLASIDPYYHSHLEELYTSQLQPANPAVLHLSEDPIGWEIGDELLVPGTKLRLYDWQGNPLSGIEDEIVTVQAVDGRNVTVSGFDFDHLPTEDNRIAVGNLTRNVEFRSENSSDLMRRAHLMIMHNDQSTLSYCAFLGMGRTDKSRLLDDTGPTNKRGRYPVHFHRCGQHHATTCNGLVVRNSPGWGLVNHSSNVIFDSGIAYDCLGAGLVGEAGDEQGEFRHCLSVGSQGSGEGVEDTRIFAGDFGHSGVGIHMQGPGIKVSGCCFAGHANAGISLYCEGYPEPDTAAVANPQGFTQSLAGIEDNLVYACQHGLRTFWLNMGETIDFAKATFLRLKFWNVFYGGWHKYTVCLYDGCDFLGTHRGQGLTWISAYSAQGKVKNTSVRGFTVGTNLPRNPQPETPMFDGGLWENTTDFELSLPSEGTLIRGIADASLLPALWTDPLTRYVSTNRASWLLEQNGETVEAYAKEQASGYVPFPDKKEWQRLSQGVPEVAGQDWTGLTNREIYEQFGKLPQSLAPQDAEDMGGYLIGEPFGG